MFWKTIVPLDWGFIVLVPLLIVFFFYHLRKGFKEYLARVANDESRVEMAFIEWLQTPCEETEAKVDAAVKDE